MCFGPCYDSDMAEKKAVSNEVILKTLLSMDERMNDFATSNQLEKVKEELLEEIRPIGKAVDKDAVTIVNHERRITRVEKHLSLSK